jgi:hypothetical protein
MLNSVTGLGIGFETVQRIPVSCEGSYRLTTTLTVKRGLNIIGTYKTSTTGVKEVACELNYEGTGDLFVAPDIGEIYSDLAFRNLWIRDVNATASKAFNMIKPSGMTQENIFISGFQYGWYLIGQMTYGRIENVHARLYRKRCMEVAGPAHNAYIDVHCSASSGTSVDFGIKFGAEPGLYSVTQSLRLKASVEALSGLPVLIAEQRGINADIFVEQGGLCSNFSFNGSIYLTKIHGGKINVDTNAVCTGGTIARGVYVVPEPNHPEPSVNNVIITGWIRDTYNIPLEIVKGPGMWGNDITGLQFDASKSFIGDFTTGVIIGETYFTHGLVPIVDEGMGNTGTGSVWRVGTMIWNQGVFNQSSNLFHLVTVAGNPPSVTRAYLPPTKRKSVAVDEADPSILIGSIYHGRLELEPDADTPITNFRNPIEGLCIDIMARGTRTVSHNTNIRLAGSVPYNMADGNTLRLCADTDDFGPWREFSRCANCVR